MKLNWRKVGLNVGRVMSCVAATLFLTGVGNAQKCIGINDHVIWRTNAEQDAAFLKYADSGTKFLRVGADWNALQSVQPASPTNSQLASAYNATYLARIDYFFQKCTAANIRVLLNAAYAPDWANTAATGNAGGWSPSPAYYSAYADFCEFLLRRYTAPAYVNADGQHTLEAIEIWNEPNLADAFFKPYFRNDAAGGTAYGNMVVAAGGRIKSVRSSIGASDVLILAPVISQVHEVCWAPSGDTTWMDAFYGVAGVTSNYDVFAWHSYWESSGTTGWLPPELPTCWTSAQNTQIQSVLGKLTVTNSSEIWSKMAAHGDNLKPNWCTEIGGAAKSGTADHPNRFLSLGEQQTHLADAITTLQVGNVSKLDRIYWYELFDEPHLYGQGNQAYFGLMALNATNPIVYSGAISLAGAAITPKAAYTTYKNANKGTTAIAFSDDFNDGNSNGWTATPSTWAVVGTEYVSPHNASVGITSVGDAAWQNYSGQAKMKFSNAWKSAGLIARYNGTAGYYLKINVSDTIASYTIQLLKGTTVVATFSIPNVYNFQLYHTVKIAVKDEAGGTRIQGFIDGNQHINYLDASAPYTAGKFALRAEPWTGTVTVDDVAVNSN